MIAIKCNERNVTECNERMLIDKCTILIFYYIFIKNKYCKSVVKNAINLSKLNPPFQT